MRTSRLRRWAAGPSGSNTGLNFPNSVALDGSGNRYVSNQGVGGVKIYAAAATGNASPAGTITSGVSVPQGLAFLPWAQKPGSSSRELELGPPPGGAAASGVELERQSQLHATRTDDCNGR